MKLDVEMPQPEPQQLLMTGMKILVSEEGHDLDNWEEISDLEDSDCEEEETWGEVSNDEQLSGQ